VQCFCWLLIVMYLKTFLSISNIILNIIYEFNHINWLIIQTGNARTKTVTKYKKEITILICLFVMIIRLCPFSTITVHTNLHILYYTFHQILIILLLAINQIPVLWYYVLWFIAKSKVKNNTSLWMLKFVWYLFKSFLSTQYASLISMIF